MLAGTKIGKKKKRRQKEQVPSETEFVAKEETK